jgi:hypothetical protein
MEVLFSRRQTGSTTRNPPIDPRHEPRQPVLGASRIHGKLLKLGMPATQPSSGISSEQLERLVAAQKDRPSTHVTADRFVQAANPAQQHHGQG